MATLLKDLPHGSLIVAETVGHEVQPEGALVNARVDSISAVKIGNRLQEAFSIQLAAMLVHDHPTMKALGQVIWKEMKAED